MAEPGTSNTERHFPTFHRLWRILCIMVRLKVTRYLLLPLVLLYAGVWGVLRYNDHVLTKKYDQAEADLEQLSTQVGQYKDKTGQYPRSMDDLVRSGIVQTPPIDPFSKNKEPYRIINLNNGAMVRVYSVGEDGVDNHSIKDYTVVAHEEIYYGEKGMGLYETLQIEWTKDDPDNGMSYFMRGMLASEFDTEDPALDKMSLIQDHGWDRTFEYLRVARGFVKRTGVRPSPANPIPGIPNDFIDIACDDSTLDSQGVLDLITRNETAFELIHNGAGKPYVKAIMPDDDISYMAPQPNLLWAMYLNKAMIAHGKWMEKHGNPESAIETYLDAIRLSQVIGLTGTITGKLVGNSMESTAYMALIESVSDFEAEPNRMKSLIQQIESLDQTESNLTDIFHAEHLCFVRSLDHWGYIGNKAGSVTKTSTSLTISTRLSRAMMRDRLVRNNESYSKYASEYISKPYPLSFNEDPTVILDEMDPFNRFSFPDLTNLKVRDYHPRICSAAAKIVIGLRHYRTLHGTYPDSLDAIADLYESKTPPVDPFTTKAFVYEKSGDSFLLYSPGPELVDDKAAILYDPTNGTVSVGDIVYGK